MRVRDVMTGNPVFCKPETNLAEATKLMWKTDCGALPVVRDGKLAGIVTDRDICIAIGTRGKRACELTAGEVATPRVETCLPTDDIHSAMASMEQARVRRLPVVGPDGQLEGILALSDIAMATDGRHGSIAAKDVLNTLRTLSEPHTSKVAAAPKAMAAAS
jgi:CBS domain-containing protein